jgi:hypothetical protein
MQLDKQSVISFLETKGTPELVSLAKHELPAVVDHVGHAELLKKFGIDPREPRAARSDEQGAALRGPT